MRGTVPVNPEAGEVALEVKGAGGDVLETYVIHFGTNACARLESLLGDRDVAGRVTPTTIERLMPRLAAPGFTDIRAMIAAGLGDRHPGLTLEAAGDLIDKVGITKCAEAVAIGFKAAFPDVFGDPAERQPDAVVKEGKGKGRGTGSGLSGMPRRPASAP